MSNRPYTIKHYDDMGDLSGWYVVGPISGLEGERLVGDSLKQDAGEARKLADNMNTAYETGQSAANAELLAVVRLCDEVLTRSDLSGNFLGDDEHELWSKARAALAKHGAKG